MNDNNFAGNSKYGIDFLGNEWKYECMGCAISSGKIKIPGGIVYEGKYTKAVLEWGTKAFERTRYYKRNYISAGGTF